MVTADDRSLRVCLFSFFLNAFLSVSCSMWDLSFLTRNLCASHWKLRVLTTRRLEKSQSFLSFLKN